MVTVADVNKRITDVEKKREEEKKDLEGKITELKDSIQQQKIQQERWSEETMKDLKEELKRDFDVKLEAAKLDFEKKVENQTEILMKIINKKDEDILKLNLELKSLEDKTNIIQHTNKQQTENIQEQKEKNADLEDRSRRQNLLFYGIEEKDKETAQECETFLSDLILEKGLMEREDVWIDRAHRIGKKQEGKNRPIIAKFTYYKQKEEIRGNGRKLARTGITMSSDYSKLTTEKNKTIYKFAKKAKEEDENIKKFYVNYKYVTMFYSVKGRDFKKNFNLKQMLDDRNGWYKVKNF